jgi:hypothetical protein
MPLLGLKLNTINLIGTINRMAFQTHEDLILNRCRKEITIASDTRVPLRSLVTNYYCRLLSQMPPSRFKYWIGEDGLAHIRKADMPRPVIVDAYSPEGQGPKIKIMIKDNPLYEQIRGEVLALTGSEKKIIEADKAQVKG